MFAIIGIFNFIYRITYLDNGKCVIGMQRPVLIPLVSFDLAVNVCIVIHSRLILVNTAPTGLSHDPVLDSTMENILLQHEEDVR